MCIALIVGCLNVTVLGEKQQQMNEEVGTYRLVVADVSCFQFIIEVRLACFDFILQTV